MSKLFAFLLALAAVVHGSASKWKCTSQVESAFEFTNVDIAKLNPHLSNSQEYLALRRLGCSDTRPTDQVCFDKPGIGSGLTQISMTDFLASTDAGPNQDCATLARNPALHPEAVGRVGKAFPLTSFAPTIAHVTLANANRLRLQKAVPLRGSDGSLITGLPNTVEDDTPYGPNCAGDALPYDPSGLDTEDISVITGTDYAVLVDEYGPSVVVANYKTGVIAARHVPRRKAQALSNARYPIIGDLPNVYAQRRKNRGFEGVVVDPNGLFAIAIMQSPMLGADETKTENNAIIRCAYFAISYPNSRSSRPVLEYKRSFIIEGSPISSFRSSMTKPTDIKYSAAYHHSGTKFVVLERATNQVKLFLIDFNAATHLETTKYADNLGLERDTNGDLPASSFGVTPAEKTLLWDSASGTGGTSNWRYSGKQEGFVLDARDPTKVWMVNDNDFGLGRNGNTELLKITLGRNISGSTVCPLPAHPPKPRINVEPSRAIRLTNSQTYRISTKVDGGAAENLDVDEDMKVAYVANGLNSRVDRYGITTSSPVVPQSSTNLVRGFEPTSVSVCKTMNRVAIGFANDDNTLQGFVQITDKDFKVEELITDVGCFLPDAVKWSDDCAYLVVACEGEGKDVPGGVLVMDYNNKMRKLRSTRLASFREFDGMASTLRANGVRLIESDIASLDLQPEFITIVGGFAYITVQEANAVAVVDLAEAKITELKPLGFIDRSRPGFGLDASNRDERINIRNYPRLFGMPQPDTIVAYTARDGATYLVMSNEGDALEPEEIRAADIIGLGRTVASELGRLISDDKLLGRLKITNIDGYDVASNKQNAIYNFGTRSFSIMALTGEVVFDSGEWFARIMEKHYPRIFNANTFEESNLTESQSDTFDNRSDDKGGEPESLAILSTGDGRNYAFIGIERASIIVVFDISEPRDPVFVDAVRNHPIDVGTEELFSQRRQGDLDPEGLFASARLRKLVVAGSVSNTVSTYDIEGLN